MKFYPAYLDLRERPCLVIGGGEVAERKALSLLAAGASVTVVSPELTPKLLALADSGVITHLQKKFDTQDLGDSFLVIAATNSREVNAGAGRACKQLKILVNVVMPPEESTFIVPSVVERGDLLIALSTSGASPALAGKMRKELETRYGPEYADFLAMLAAVRKQILNEVADEGERLKIFQALVDSDMLDLLRKGERQMAEARMRDLTKPPKRG